jgi:hypothetical protein
MACRFALCDSVDRERNGELWAVKEQEVGRGRLKMQKRDRFANPCFPASLPLCLLFFSIFSSTLWRLEIAAIG